jgi:hypothetical protein
VRLLEEDGMSATSDIPTGLQFVQAPPAPTTFNVLLWGQPKSGKSTAAATAPGPILWINAEGLGALGYARKTAKERGTEVLEVMVDKRQRNAAQVLEEVYRHVRSGEETLPRDAQGVLNARVDDAVKSLFDAVKRDDDLGVHLSCVDLVRVLRDELELKRQVAVRQEFRVRWFSTPLYGALLRPAAAARPRSRVVAAGRRGVGGCGCCGGQEAAQVNPVELIEQIDRDAADLDRLSKAIHHANARLDVAEHNWEVVYDQMAETLKEEMDEDGRKGDPAEHWILSTARRRFRPVWQEYREAKRAVDKLERQLKAKTAALSGRQSELNALKAELRVAA